MTASVQEAQTITVERRDCRVHPQFPPGSLYEIRGTKWLSADAFQMVAALPGAFFSFGPAALPMPATGSVAFGEWTSKGTWPEPVYVPVAQRQALEALLGVDLSRLSLSSSSPEPVASFQGLDGTGQPYRLYPFQTAAIQRARTLRRATLPLRTGYGKTVVATGLGHDLLTRGDIDRVVVAAPRRSLSEVWEPLLRQFLGPTATITSVVGSPAVRSKLWPTAATSQWVLTRYDLWRLGDGKQNLSSLLGPRTLVVVDEVHHLKHTTTRRWRAFRDLLDKSRTEYRLFMTGTLLHDTPLDAFGPIELLGMHVWNTAVEFEDRYFTIDRVKTAQTDWQGNPVYARRIVGLKGDAEASELRSVIDAVSAIDPLHPPDVDLPPLVELDHVVVAEREERALYNAIVRPTVNAAVERVVADGTGYETLLATMTMERLFSDDPGLLLTSESETARMMRTGIEDRLKAASPGSKMRSVVAYLASVVEETDSKVVVFSAFAAALERLLVVVENGATGWEKQRLGRGDGEDGESMGSLRGRILYYHGGLTDREGAKVYERFRTDPAMRVLLSTDAGGESMNLQDVASYVVDLDEPLSLGNATQRVGRVYRHGQTRRVTATRFLLDTTVELRHDLEERDSLRAVDRRIRDLLNWKKEQRDKVLG